MFHQFQPQGSCGIALEPLSGSRLRHLWLRRRRNLINGARSLERGSEPGRRRGMRAAGTRSCSRESLALRPQAPNPTESGVLVENPPTRSGACLEDSSLLHLGCLRQPRSPRSRAVGTSLPRAYLSFRLSNQYLEITLLRNFSGIGTLFRPPFFPVDFTLLTLVAVINSFIHAFARVGVRRPDPIMSYLLFCVLE